jgi:hypothetical protein
MTVRINHRFIFLRKELKTDMTGNPIDEVRRGKQLAEHVANDKGFVESFQKIKQGERKTKILISYLYKRGLATHENVLTFLSLEACVYFLESRYGINDIRNSNLEPEEVQYYEMCIK